MTDAHDQIARTVANRFSQLPEVEAVALAGSVATGRAGALSDVDVYIYPAVDLAPEVRLSIGREFSPDAQRLDYWGPAVMWFDPATGIEVEALFFNTRWMEDLVLKPLEQHQASTGFSTSFWHTVKVSRILFDRNGWLTRLQHRAQQPYPAGLVQAIVRLNYPLLRTITPSYRTQIAIAVQRHDLVLINRKVVAFLASYFDILFALNRLPHPGEKRMLDIIENECDQHPAQLRDRLTRLLQLASSGSDDIFAVIDGLIDDLTTLLQRDGLLTTEA